MRAEWVLLLRASGVTVWRIGRRGARAVAEHAPDAAGRAACVRTLRAARGTPVRLLADLHGERFALDSIPRLRGAERQCLLERRLDQRFAGSGCRYSRVLGRTANGRQRILLACLHQEALEPWLAVPEAAGAYLSGVCSVPLLLAACLRRRRAGAAACLLVNLDRGGARAGYFQDRQPVFSRPLELPPGAVFNAAPGAGAEAESFQWLAGELRAVLQRLREGGHRLPEGGSEETSGRDLPELHLLAPAACRKTLCALRGLPGGLRLVWLDSARAARRAGLPGAAPAPDALLVRLAVRRGTPNHYAAPGKLRPWQRRRRAVLLRAAVCACLSLGLPGTALWGAEGLRLQREIRALSAAAPLPADTVAALPPLPPAFPRTHRSGPLLRGMEAALRAVPELRLEELRWGWDRASGEPRSAVYGAPSARSAGAEVFTLRARARLAVTEPRQQLRAWHDLEAALRAVFPAAALEPLEWPLDPNPRAGLEGRLEQSAVAAEVMFLVHWP